MIKNTCRLNIASWLLISLGLFFASCEYKDLCYDHTHLVDVRVQFDWSLEPEAQPAGMTVMFYNMDKPSAEPIRFDFPGRDGGAVQLQPGNYRAVAFNNDTESLYFRGMEAVSTMEAYTRLSSIEEGTQLTRTGMPRAATTENQNVILAPDLLWTAVGEPFKLDISASRTYDNNKGGKTDTKYYVITLQPSRRVCDVTVIIRNVPNLKYTMNQYGGALSGLAQSVFMGKGLPSDELATQAFPIYAIDGTTLQAEFHAFSHCPDGATNSHLLTVYAILADGSKWYYTIDVTQQMHEQLEKNGYFAPIIIEVDGLPIPKPIVNGSGFQPAIDDWQNVDIAVGM